MGRVVWLATMSVIASTLSISGVTTAVGASNSIPLTPFNECPAVGYSPSCGILIVVNPDLTVSVYGDSSVGPFDGGDDTLVGILNESSTPVDAVTVTGPGSSLGDLDGDGLCAFITCSYSAPTGYEGPDNTFVTDPSQLDAAEIDFTTSLQQGVSTYFSLEGALTAASLTGRRGHLGQRYVALGDSVPYGHGLANPYPNAQIGLPSTNVLDGPSANAYPVLVARALGLSQSVRSSNCTLTGDDLAISGAKGSAQNTTQGNDQCSQWSTSMSVQDELDAANLSTQPAKLITIQAGADDINFGDCMAWELTKIGKAHALGSQCVANGTTTAAVTTELSHLRSDLAGAIEQAAAHSERVAVLNYYQVIPDPSNFSPASVYPNGSVDPVCWGLQHNLNGAHADAVVLQKALNDNIAAAIGDAVAAGHTNVIAVDISTLEHTHEICTGNPALFSSRPSLCASTFPVRVGSKLKRCDPSGAVLFVNTDPSPYWRRLTARPRRSRGNG